MVSGKRAVSRKLKKPARKAKRAKSPKTVRDKKTPERRKSPVVGSQVDELRLQAVPKVRERYVVTVDNIRGDTAIGDLLVTFPRTRDVLARKGLRLEAEDAGDIYMTLDVFSAMNGLETATLVQEIVEVAKEPTIPPTQLATPPIP